MEEGRVEMFVWSTEVVPQGDGQFTGTIVLGDDKGERFLAISTTTFDVAAVGLAMERPDDTNLIAYGLMKRIVEEFGENVEEIVIDVFDNNQFGSTIGFKTKKLKARPSEAIALAIHFNAPIYTTEDVLNKAGEDKQGNSLKNQLPVRKIISRKKELGRLRTALNKAISREEYEKCAILRDQIREMEEKLKNNTEQKPP